MGYLASYRSGHLLMTLVGLLLEADRGGEAVRHIEEGISSRILTGDSLRRARLIAGGFRGEHRDFSAAATQFKLVLEEDPDDREAFWNLIACELELGDVPNARRVLDKYGLDPITERETGLWGRVFSDSGWSETAASKAVTFALREGTSAGLATSLLGSVIMQTRGTSPSDTHEDVAKDARPSVPGDIHAEAFRAIEALIAKHGDKFGFKLITFDEDKFIDQIKELLGQRDRRPIADLLREMRKGAVPIGMLCGVRNDPYSLVLAGQIGDTRIVSQSDPSAHDVENRHAALALGGKVVVDLSAIELAVELDCWDVALGEFTALQTTTAQRLDASRGVSAARSSTASSGYLGQDASGNVHLSESGPNRQLEILRRCEAVEAALRPTRSTPVEGPWQLSSELDDLDRPVWLETIELALREKLPLWTDDLGQRRLALALGIPSFGTVNLLEARSQARLDGAVVSEAVADVVIADQVALISKLIDHRVVDQPVTEPLVVENIKKYPNELAPAVEVLSRASWWAEEQSLDCWARIIGAVRESAPDTVRFWQARAAIGIAASTSPDVSSRLVAIVSVLGCDRAPSVSEAAEGFRLVEAIFQDLELPPPSDQVMWAVASVADLGLIESPVVFAEELIAELRGNPEDPDITG